MADDIIATIGAMVLVVIVAATLYAVSSQIINQVPQNEETTSLEINDTEAFEQLVMYNTLIAHKCGDWGGGLPGWEVFKQQNDFSELKAAGSDLGCDGSDFVAPLSGGPQEVGSSATWRDDQEGRYSRMKFRVPKSEDGTNRIELDKSEENRFSISAGDKTLYIYSHGTDQPNKFLTNRDFTPNDIDDIALGSNEYYATLTMIDSEYRRTPDGQYNFIICEGSEGYIQTNTGANSKENDIDEGNRYSKENTPGVDKEKGGSGIGTDNKLHPFVVITKNTCDGNEFGNGVWEEGQIINYGSREDEEIYAGKTLHVSVGSQTFEDKQARLGEMRITDNQPDYPRCWVDINDGAGFGTTYGFKEGHLIRQEGSIANDDNTVEIRRVGGGLDEVSNNPDGERNLMFTEFDKLNTETSIRRVGEERATNLATQRAFFSNNQLADDRYMARPEGDLICGTRENRLQWILCGPEFVANDGDNRVTVEGETYRCEFSDDSYPVTGEASWVKVS